MTTQNVTPADADRIADETADPHVLASYGTGKWRKAARQLAAVGYSESDIVNILQAKWTRRDLDREIPIHVALKS